LLLSLRGDLDQAHALHSQALAIHEEFQDRRSAMIDRANLGGVALERGSLSEAARELDAAINVAEALGDVRALGAFLADRARVHLALGETDRCGQRLDRSEALLSDFDARVERAKALCVRVELMRATEQDETATLGEVYDIAADAGAGPLSSLGRALQRISVIASERSRDGL